MGVALTRPEIVADIVLDNVAKGSPISVADAIRQVPSYAPSIAGNPTKVTKTALYQARMAKGKIRIAKMLEKQQKLAIARAEKTINKASYRDSMYGLDIATKNKRLELGESTENITTLSGTIAEAIALRRQAERGEASQS